MSPETLRYTMHALTDPGRVRRNNEDAVVFDEMAGLCVLADGMGGANAGEVASSMATQCLRSGMLRWLAKAGRTAADPMSLRQALQECAEQANRDILQDARIHPGHAGMGTTLVVGVFHDDRLQLGHAGDSRCYLYRRGELRQLTRDHSFVQEQVDAGLMTPAQAAASVKKNLVTRVLGVVEGVVLELHEHVVEMGDLYLMCSDGLSDMLSDADIAAILAKSPVPQQQAQALIDQANRRGGRDNITVLLARVDEKGPVFGETRQCR